VKEELRDMRKEYRGTFLDAEFTPGNPLELFDIWMKEAVPVVTEPNAMTLATVDEFLQPFQRVVLLKEIYQGGFVFFTNYQSRKAQQMNHDPRVSLHFFWQPLARQVMICGAVEKMPFDYNERYFQSRPRDSQIGAWASPQSKEIGSREVIEEAFDVWMQKYDSSHLIPCPDHWGGYIVSPQKIEFWQGQPSRLHDRLIYTLQEETWSKMRLAP